MSFPIWSKYLSPLELQYAELKKQSIVDQNNNQAQNGSKEHKKTNITDEVTLTLPQPKIDEPARRKPYQPVTPDEILALRGQFSVYA